MAIASRRIKFTKSSWNTAYFRRIIRVIFGAIAQLVERYNGIVEVRGSTALGSTPSHVGARAATVSPFSVTLQI